MLSWAERHTRLKVYRRVVDEEEVRQSHKKDRKMLREVSDNMYQRM